MPELRYPNDPSFFRDLILQRTDALTRLVGFAPIAKWFSDGDGSQIESYFFSESIRDQVLDAIEVDFSRDTRQVLSLLSSAEQLNNVVSIGPGNGVLETMLLKKLSPRSPDITLIDIESSDSHHHGYATTGSGYANLTKTRDFMVGNGLKRNSIRLCNPQVQSLPDEPFDLLISILSMGFHYPCDGYSEYIKRKCNPFGLVIIDKRKMVVDRGYDSLLESGFVELNKIDFGKFDRVALTRSKSN